MHEHTAQPLAQFTDVRELQRQFDARGLTPTTAPRKARRPASFTLVDPDGNPIPFAQHVPAR